jgi:ribosomal protein L10
MGRTIENKKAIVADLKETLNESTLALVIEYQGLTVGEMSDLRRRLRPSGTVCKVTKNTLMGIAIEGEDKWQPMSELLKGSSAFLLVKEDFSGAIKAYQDFQKASKKTELRGGVMDGRLLKNLMSRYLETCHLRNNSWRKLPELSTAWLPRLLWVSTKYPVPWRVLCKQLLTKIKATTPKATTPKANLS